MHLFMDFRTRLGCLEAYRTEFETLQSEIETLDQAEFGSTERETFDENQSKTRITLIRIVQT